MSVLANKLASESTTDEDVSTAIESFPTRILLSLVLAVGSLGFGLVAAAPKFLDLKPNWAQYQRFSDFFVIALALGLSALVIALLGYKKSSWAKVGFNKVWSAVIVSAFSVFVAVYAGLGALSVLHK